MIFEMHVHLPGNYDRDTFGSSLSKVAAAITCGATHGQVLYDHPEPGGEALDPIIGRWSLDREPFVLTNADRALEKEHSDD